MTGRHVLAGRRERRWSPACRRISAAQARARSIVLLVNGKIITVDDRFTVAQAMAIRGERIVAVGTNADVARLAGPGHAAHRPGRQGRHPRAHRQPHAPAARRHHLAVGGAARRRRLARAALELLRARAARDAAGRVDLHARRLGRWSSSPTTRGRSRARSSIAWRRGHPLLLQASYYQSYLNSRALEALAWRASRGSSRRRGSHGIDEAGIRALAARLPTAIGRGARAQHPRDDPRAEPGRPDRLRQRRLRGRTCCRSIAAGRAPAARRARVLHHRRDRVEPGAGRSRAAAHPRHEGGAGRRRSSIEIAFGESVVRAAPRSDVHQGVDARRRRPRRSGDGWPPRSRRRACRCTCTPT